MRKKITHILSSPAQGDSITDHIVAAPIGVYGRKDLKARLKAAKEAGVPVQVRKVPRKER
ncbi:hypothetical protein DMB42_11420 [Nonomuraea sp. WAC 01424]|uniref:hypothetical protein n=1 Tax=Nonomuraea sp. WAC 01424 TaxID=2203200 RepID=UPI000F767FDE|nr:hypothetical protein [Nonomuraea sp. WAC 01424]RSN12780.1 hypothetical protein DMB42_11420 [Nonomuraea sp. WAC 01424]